MLVGDMMLARLRSEDLDLVGALLSRVPDGRVRSHVQTVLMASAAGAAVGIALGAAVGAAAAGAALGAGVGLVAGCFALHVASRRAELPHP